MSKWNLTGIYKNHDEFIKDLKSLDEDIKYFLALKGKLNNLDTVADYYEHDEALGKKIERIYVYASMNYDLNQKDNERLKDYNMVYEKYSDLIAKTSFITPELIANGSEKFAAWIKENKILEENAYNIKKMFRSQKHVFDAKLEYIMANYQTALGGYSQMYDALAVADNNSSIVKISTGEELEINESNFRYYLGILKNQDDRRLVFEAVFKFYYNHKNTFAALYKGIMQSDLATVKNRKYDSILDSYLEKNAIPVSVYESLITATKKYSEPIKRYYKIRAKYFGIEKTHTYDRFLDFATSNKKYNYAESKKMVLEAMEEFNKEFALKCKSVLEDGRVDSEIADGKRTGAYSTSIYENGPFILLNHSGTLDDAFTIAHEAGHSMHTLFSNENQPYATANYVIFVAEIASTFNEQIFLDYMLRHSKDKNEKLSLVAQAIDGLLATFYRQALFADYEYQVSKRVENGLSVTASDLCKIMHDLYWDYYEIDLNDEPYKDCVWAYIPHLFHSPFYVYQYATSYASSLALYQNVKEGKPNAYEKYIGLLKSGGSDDPVELVAKAGVDLTKTDAFMAVVDRLNELLDELEKLI
mgnify:FL=1